MVGAFSGSDPKAYVNSVGSPKARARASVSPLASPEGQGVGIGQSLGRDAFGPGPAADFEDSVGALLLGTPKRFPRTPQGSPHKTLLEDMQDEDGADVPEEPDVPEVQMPEQPLPEVPAFPEPVPEGAHWRPSLRLPS